MSNERFGIGGDAEGGVWTATPIYLDSLVDTVVDSPTDGFVLTYEASSGKWKAKSVSASDTKVYVYEEGVQVGTVARFLNFDGDDFNITEDAGNDWFLVEAVAAGMIAHDMTGAYHTEDATGGVGNVIRATGATAFAWAQLGHGDLGGVTPDLHHAQSHVLSGGDHSASGLTIGDAIMADSPTTFSWQTPSYYNSFTTDFSAESLANLTTRAHSDLSDAPTDAHHSESHALDAAVHTGSLPWSDLDLISSSLADLATRAHGNLSDAPTDAHHTEGHVLAVTGPHTGSLPLTDLDPSGAAQGSMMRYGASDWEVLTKGTSTYVLKAGAATIAWGQVDYSELTGTQPNPVAHTLAGALHTATSLTVGWVIAADSATTFSWQAPSGGTDDDAIHDNVAQEIQPITGKGSPVGADVILIEDSADSWNKKSVTITNLPGGADPNAIHDNVDGEIQPITPKGTPVGADVIIIEDSAASWAKKSVTISNLPAGSPSFGVPTGNIDIGDSAAEGSSGDSTRADHQHQFSAPGAGYPLDIADTESDGTASTPARSDHVHKHPTGLAASAHHTKWTTVDTEIVITAELVNGQSIDNAIDSLISTHNVADNHIAHSGVTITAGTGLSGGGTIAANRTINCDITQYTNAMAVAAVVAEDPLSLTNALNIGSIVAGVADYDKFLVSDTGLVKFRTGAEAYADMDGYVTADFTTDFAAESLANLGTRAHGNLSDAPTDAHHNEIHVLATTGPHSGTLPVADIANGTQYQYLRAGASTPEFQARTFTISATVKSPTVGYTTVWRAPIGCTCTKLEGRQKGGTSTIINARYNGTTDVATGDLTLTAANTWYDTTGIAQTAWSATDWLEFEVQALGGATEITFVLTFTEP